MLSASYTTVTAVVLVVGGLLACFAGYRLFRLVLGLYGFAAGAIITTVVMSDAGIWTLVLAALVGGLVGAMLMLAAYFFGVGLIGAGLSVLGINVVWQFVGGDPPTAVLVIVAVLGALAALAIARFVVIFGTALAGSWTALLGALALGGRSEMLEAVAAGDVWILISPQPEGWGLAAAWLGLTLAGVLAQLAMARRRRRRKKRAD
jgi:hypothetical protein